MKGDFYIALLILTGLLNLHSPGQRDRDSCHRTFYSTVQKLLSGQAVHLRDLADLPRYHLAIARQQDGFFDACRA